jgi:subtilisin
MLLAFCSLAFAQAEPAQTDRPDRRVLVGFHENGGPRTPESRAAVVRDAGGQVHASFSLIPVVSARLPEPAIANLQRRPEVAYVEDDVQMSIVQAPPQTMAWGVDRIDAEKVWSPNTGAGQDVAILDTGIDYDHPDLQANVRGGIYFAGWIFDELFGKDGSTNPADWNDGHGHGTHCAGIVAAINNEIGVVGVAPSANLWGVKVLDDNGSGYTSDIIQGLQWCATHAIEVASMSFGGGGTASLQSACQAAYDAGVLLVAAAGNDNGGPVSYPAAYSSVMAVSAVGQNPDGTIYLAGFSNVGPQIELAAPGVSINSTFKDGGYQVWSGTSMACPHVAGAAALVWATGLNSPSAVRARLCETAEDLGSAGWDASYGYGLVDAEAAARGGTPTDAPPSLTITNPTGGATVSGTVAVAATASDDKGVTQVEFFVNSVSIGTDTISSDGWSASWDTTQSSDGSYTVSATATDTAGQTASDSVNVTVANTPVTDTPPTVAITNPTAGATVSRTIAVTANASDDQGVTQVEFFVNGVSIGIDTDSSGGWSTSWDTTQSPNGSYTVRATATDTVGQTGSHSVTVTVDNTQDLPVAQVTVSASTMTITRKSWIAMVEIWVKVNGKPLVGATVEGYWSGLYSKAVVETTDEFGFVGLLKSFRTPGTVTFTVTGVADGGNRYTLDPEKPSDSTQGP